MSFLFSLRPGERPWRFRPGFRVHLLTSRARSRVYFATQENTSSQVRISSYAKFNSALVFACFRVFRHNWHTVGFSALLVTACFVWIERIDISYLLRRTFLRMNFTVFKKQKKTKIKWNQSQRSVSSLKKIKLLDFRTNFRHRINHSSSYFLFLWWTFGFSTYWAPNIARCSFCGGLERISIRLICNFFFFFPFYAVTGLLNIINLPAVEYEFTPRLWEKLFFFLNFVLILID